jgi:ribosomal protein S18 acetylase RimI-like enzyme
MEPVAVEGEDGEKQDPHLDAPPARPGWSTVPPQAIDAWRADLGPLSEVLLRAFFDDPLMEWLCPDETRRRRALPAFFWAVMALVTKRGRVLTTTDRSGAAAWAAPEQWRMPTADTLRVAVVLAHRFGPRIRIGLGLFNQIEKEHPEEPHWYVAVIGTDPAQLGRGVGGSLIREVTDQCDASGVGAYLESSKETNVPYYQRFGFKVTGEIRYKDSPPLFKMWRDPA